jgi:hypothetical protein
MGAGSGAIDTERVADWCETAREGTLLGARTERAAWLEGGATNGSSFGGGGGGGAESSFCDRTQRWTFSAGISLIRYSKENSPVLQPWESAKMPFGNACHQNRKVDRN